MDFCKYFIFFTIVLAVDAQSNGTKSIRHYLSKNVTSLRTGNYIDLNRRQFADYILEFDRQMDTFRQHYSDRLDIVSQQMALLVDGLEKTNERLNPLEVLSDISKDCVSKYRSKIPTIANTKTAIQGCINTASAQVNNMLSSPETTKRNLQNYYLNTFEKELVNCEKRFPTMDANYTGCITTVIANSVINTKSYQKTFGIQMDAAQCTHKANIKTALDCSFIHQNRTIALNTEANLMIDKCLQGQDDCERCSAGHICDNVYYMPEYQVDFKNSTMINPFYGRNTTSDCLMLEIY